MKRKTLILNIVLGALLVAGGVVAYLMITGDKPATATSVRTVAVQQGTVTSTVTADGTVGSANSMSADFVTAGRVSAINVKLGDVVAAGTVLATVDATEPNAELATAKKNLTAAKEALSRADANGKSQAQNQVDQAKSAVDAAQRKVDGTYLKAPMAGTIVAINGAVGGQSSGSGQTGQASGQSSSSFMQLADLTKLQVNASVPEADATRLKNDQTAAITWNALANANAMGKVTSISPTAAGTGNVVSYPIVVALDTIPNGVKLGQSVKLTVTVDRVENAIYVPNAAIRSTGGRALVTVVANGKQEARLVQVGLKGDAFTVVTEGLEAGEQVVLATATTGGNTNQFPGGGLFPGGGGQNPGGGGFRQGGGQGGNQGGGGGNQ